MNSLSSKYNGLDFVREADFTLLSHLSSFQHSRSQEKPMLLMLTLTQGYFFSSIL